MNSTSETIETAKHPSVAADSQPQPSPSLSARMIGASTSATSTVPVQSIEPERVGSRDSWTVRSVTGMHAAAIAASIQNRPCQPVVSTSTPPTNGPSAPPPADAAPHNVTARICDGPEDATDSRLMPQARIVAPDAPWIIRPPMMPAAPVDSAISAQDAMNSASPARNTLRRPSTSPSAPEVTITAAPTSEYPVTAHCSVVIGAPTSSLIDGSRIVTADVLALTTSADTQAANRTPPPALRSSRAAISP